MSAASNGTLTDPRELATVSRGLLADGYRLALAAAHDDGPTLRIVYLFTAGLPDRRIELTLVTPIENPEIPSLAGISFPAGRFEREMHDLFGIVPAGHPLPRRLVRHSHWPAGWYPLRRSADPNPTFMDADTEPFPFVTVEGPGVYEIPVGPVHAGLIEPGHFRFSVVGETIVKLKARLWFVHRGIERLFEGQLALDAAPLAERISGDTSAAHALAYTLAVEDALGIVMPTGGQRLRAVLVELERIYNHVADLGSLASDVGYSVANAHAQRIREQLLRINATVTGHRLLRDAIRPGAVSLLTAPDVRVLEAVGADVAELADLTLANSTVRDRFTDTATLTAEQAADLGCLGYVARASGLTTDARVDHPFTALPVEPVVHTDGDVLARYLVRRDEIAASVVLIRSLLDEHGGRPHTVRADDADVVTSAPGSGVGIVEGWRGTIVHRVETDAAGRLTRVKVVDPSWFNWPAVPVALRDTIVPDFPLVNKSFNLSYAGNDL
jgi:Ni,Fe-hydrogenase III large subunit/Ni,Fe-hydrogenase III component G